MTDPILITPATVEPVTLQEVKDHLGIEDAASDLRLVRQLARARRNVEQSTGIGLASETWEQAFDAAELTGDRLRLGRSPVTAITSVTARYEDGTTAVMAAAEYYLVRDGLALAEGASWPEPLRAYEALAVRYVAGEVPLDGSPLREAVLKLAGWYDATRGDQDKGGNLPPDVLATLAPYLPPWVA